MIKDKIQVDVIMLSYTKDMQSFKMTQNAITSLLNSDQDYQFNIFLIEGNVWVEKLLRDLNVSYVGCILKIQYEEFNYNKYLNKAISFCKSEKVVICHNDVVFTNKWFSILSNAMEKYGLNTASPYCPFTYKVDAVSFGYECYVGNKVGKHFLNHCIVCQRYVFDAIGKLDERFDFWLQDCDFREHLIRHSFEHGLISYSIVNHLGYNSVSNSEENKLKASDILKKKYRDQIILKPKSITKSKKDIYVFFHMCCINNYVSITREIISEIISSGLYENATKIFYSILGTPSTEFLEELKRYDKFELVFSDKDITKVEYPTLLKLREFCEVNDCYVCYFHTKAVSVKDNLRHLWRKRLSQKVISQFEVCVSLLNEGCDVAGCGWKERVLDKDEKIDYIPGKYSHFSGNFWWANSDYIKKLPNLQVIWDNKIKLLQSDFLEYRVPCEFWLGMGDVIKIGINGELNKEYSEKSYYEE